MAEAGSLPVVAAKAESVQYADLCIKELDQPEVRELTALAAACEQSVTLRTSASTSSKFQTLHVSKNLKLMVILIAEVIG